MTDIAKINGLSIDDIAKIIGVSIGDIAKVNGITVPSAAPLLKTVFNSGSTLYISLCALSETSVFITYYDDANADKATALICTIGESITVGAEYEWSGDDVDTQECCKLTSELVLVVGSDKLNTNKIVACAFDIDGTTITPGTKLVVSDNTSYYPRLSRISDTSAICVYRDSVSFKPKANVLSVSGTTVTAGTVNDTFFPYTISAVQKCVDVLMLTSTAGVLVCSTRATPFTLSGTDITAGTYYTIKNISGSSIDDDARWLNLEKISDTKMLLCWFHKNGTNDYRPAALTLNYSSGTVSNDSYISYAMSSGVAATVAVYITVSNVTSTGAIMYFRSYVDLSKLYKSVISIGSGTCTCGTPTKVEDSATSYMSADTLSSGVSVIGYRDDDNSGYGTIQVI